jgi:hypothetical protein
VKWEVAKIRLITFAVHVRPSGCLRFATFRMPRMDVFIKFLVEHDYRISSAQSNFG